MRSLRLDIVARPELVLRPWTPADRGFALSLLHEAFFAQRGRYFGPPPSKQTTRRETGSYLDRVLKEWTGERGVSLVAELDGRPAGFLLAEVQTDRRNYWVSRRFGEVQELHVHPRFRRRGVGRALITAAEKEFRRRGCRVVRLSTWAFQRPARALYLGRGYRELNVKLEKRL